MEQYLRVGILTTTHGLKGEVKVFSTTDDKERFKILKDCYLDTGSGYIKLEVEGVKISNKHAILKFKQFNSINDVEKYKGKDILVDRADAVPLKENEYFITDLVGMEVVSEDGKIIGCLVDVMKTGANDVFVVQDKDKKEILLPYIKECILDINITQKKITAYLMPGLI